MKPKIWHKWVDSIFPDEGSISVESIMERLTDYIKENNKSTLNIPFKSALSHYLTYASVNGGAIKKYRKITDTKVNNLWVKLG